MKEKVIGAAVVFVLFALVVALTVAVDISKEEMFASAIDKATETESRRVVVEPPLPTLVEPGALTPNQEAFASLVAQMYKR